ncbi:cell wall-active antibiotics response protein LiaF [Chungangia koreensis]|uniref:Cell wall-active antibiotics response protein LiaF n=1 Tax=Chungangia koreensis TaxID=752657 RepID=A0ABV8X8Y8_9LACT
MNQVKSNHIAFFLIAFVLIVFIESTIFMNGSIILVLLGIGMLYYSFRKRSKAVFWIGIFFLILSLFNMWSLRFLIIAFFIYVLVRLWKGDQVGDIVKPLYEQRPPTQNGIWQNKLFSVQSTPFHSYEWQDLHVQGFFGNLTVDVTQTILPKGTSLISIRQGIGKVKIILPYEVPVRIHYTTLLGDAKLFGKIQQRLWNQSIQMKDGYEGAEYPTELVIALSTWFGDVEVIRK